MGSFSGTGAHPRPPLCDSTQLEPVADDPRPRCLHDSTDEVYGSVKTGSWT
ncbi:hypothetical protein [Streptomyces sp. NBC_00354]|uniref:hypothetical protein n=1 Tax=Streptomyces sp. NBC_00354 TaxID=2975723 RepID=UPI002E26784F